MNDEDEWVTRREADLEMTTIPSSFKGRRMSSQLMHMSSNSQKTGWTQFNNSTPWGASRSWLREFFAFSRRVPFPANVAANLQHFAGNYWLIFAVTVVVYTL
jgi:hypothetical protein